MALMENDIHSAAGNDMTADSDAHMTPAEPFPESPNFNNSGVDTTFRPRSYVITGGRTKPAVDMPIESLLAPTAKGVNNVNRLTVENKEIIELCSKSSQSIAEISAHLKLPLGVARVLAGDLAAHGLVKASMPSYHTNNKQRLDKAVLQRVLEGLEGL